MNPRVAYKMLDDEMERPAYAHDGDAGIDLRITKDVVVFAHETLPVGTGIAMAIPEGYFGDLRPRSGMATKRGITLANTPGTIDSTYRGEIIVPLRNMTSSPVYIERGERVAQLLIEPVAHATLDEVDELDETERGDNGFGSTGYGSL